ncbi:hypothetical protein ACXZ1K_11310 [Pedobacter sp. PWIIR3]
MRVHIGMMVWKEAKNHGITQAQFAKQLKDRGIAYADFFQSEVIDADILVHISDILNKNFFSYYEPAEMPIALSNKKLHQLKDKLVALREVLEKKDKLIRSQEKYIKSQENLIKTLEKKWSED